MKLLIQVACIGMTSVLAACSSVGVSGSAAQIVGSRSVDNEFVPDGHGWSSQFDGLQEFTYVNLFNTQPAGGRSQLSIRCDSSKYEIKLGASSADTYAIDLISSIGDVPALTVRAAGTPSGTYVHLTNMSLSRAQFLDLLRELHDHDVWVLGATDRNVWFMDSFNFSGDLGDGSGLSREEAMGMTYVTCSRLLQ